MPQPPPVQRRQPPPEQPPPPKPVEEVEDKFEAPKNAPPSVELTKGKTLSKAELAALGNKDLADTVAGVQQNYQKLLDAGAKILITTSAGNNGRPIVTVVPPALANNEDPKQKYDVVVHYHGMHGSVAKPNASSPVRSQIEASFKRTPPTVFVLPTAKIVPTMQGDFKTTMPVWSESVRDTGKTAADGVAGVVGSRGQLTVSAHSLGRQALTAAMKHQGLNADRIDVQDGFSAVQRKGVWHGPEDIKAVHDWVKANPGKPVRISVGMMSKEQIQNWQKFPKEAFVGNYGGGKHWQAELQPW